MIRICTLAFLIIFPIGVTAQERGGEIWNDEKSASASCSGNGVPRCQVIVNGSSIDVSQVTYTNLGKLGTNSSEDYEKIVTMPTEWLKSTSEVQMVKFKTHAWRNGQRYTVTESVLIKNGKFSVR